MIGGIHPPCFGELTATAAILSVLATFRRTAMGSSARLKLRDEKCLAF